jgi:hypothetical protein
MDNRMRLAAGRWAYEGYLAELRAELSMVSGEEFERVLSAIVCLQQQLHVIELRLAAAKWGSRNGEAYG